MGLRKLTQWEETVAKQEQAISADECCHCLRHCDVRGALARAG